MSEDGDGQDWGAGTVTVWTGLAPHRFAKLLPKMSEGDLGSLRASLKADGYAGPPIWLFEGQILDGVHRHRLCRELDIEPEFTEYSGPDALRFAINQNIARRHLNESQRGIVAARLVTTDGPGGIPQICGMPQPEAAVLLNVSTRTVQSAAAVSASSPELATACADGAITVSDAVRVLAEPVEVQREALERVKAKQARTIGRAVGAIKNERLVAEPTPAMPADVFSTIVVDPPWPMQKIDRSEKEEADRVMDYPVMTLDAIKALRWPAADAAHCWLWATQRFLWDAPAVLDAWGFGRPIFVLTWDKQDGMQPAGLPRYTSEFLVFARRGGAPFQTTRDFRMAYQWPRPKGHSVKPQEAYDLIRRVSPGPHLEAFARGPREGFSVWGNEA